MSQAMRTITIVFIFVVLWAHLQSVEATTFTLLAVSVNGSIPRQFDVVTLEPGDTVVLEVWVWDWSPEGERLRSWQIYLSGDSLSNEGNVPLELAADVCLFPGLGYMLGGCIFPEVGFIVEGCFIEKWRTDYVFYDRPSLPSTDPYSLPCRAGDSLFNVFDAPVFTVPRYLATVILNVPLGACGTFEIDFGYADGRDVNGLRIDPIRTNSVVLHVNQLCPCPLQIVEATSEVASSPPNCAIDAREPNFPDGLRPLSFRTAAYPFLRDDGCAGPELADFSLREVPSPDVFEPRNSVVHIGVHEDMATMLFERAIVPDRWTCVSYTGIDRGQACWGHLPGDVNNDGQSTAEDVEYLIGCITGQHECADYQCNIDREGAGCSPADTLRLIDVLNGAANYEVWLDREIAKGKSCPSAP